MSITILGGDFTVHFTNDVSGAGDKQIIWTGSAVGTRTTNELYSAIADLFDNNTAGSGDYMDEGIPMSAQTPTAYTVGRIETNDIEPWFIDPESVTHLTGGALTTTGWTRSVGSLTGIVKVICSSVGFNLVSSDVGSTVTHADGDSGKILYVDTTNFEVWIRPDSNAAANSFDSTTGGTLTATGSSNTATQETGQASTTGNLQWTNLNTIGTIVPNTRIYVTQNNTEIENFWGDGLLDRLILVSDFNGLIDGGVVTVYARQYSTTYDYIEVDLSGGGRVPAPISTGLDRINNPSGIFTVSVSGASSAFTSGELVTGSVSGGQVVVLENTGSPTTSFTYYTVGDLTNIANGDTLTGSIAGANGTSGTPASTGPSGFSDITFTFGHNSTFDINADSTNEDYSIVINCNNRPLSEVYERCKYVTSRGQTSLLNGIEGQQYLGIDYKLDYNTLTGTISTGSTVTQVTSGATAVVVAHDTTNNVLMLRDTTGTFNTTNNVEVDGSNFVTMTGGSIEIITPLKTSPFGSFAGGTFFGARGVVLQNVPTADSNNYQLLDNAGNLITEPLQVSFVLTGLKTDSEVRIFDDSATNFNFDKEITGTESSTSQLQSVLIANGGSGYSVSDVLTLTGGTFTTAAQLTVTSIGGGGAITGVSISNAGSDYSTNPPSPTSVTGGGGSGATFNTEFAGSFTYQYTYATDIPITYVVFHLNFRDVRQTGVLSDTNQSIPISQGVDRVFLNP